MVYVVIGIALFCLTVKGYCGKKTSGYVKDAGDSLLFNLWRMLFCMLIGIALVFAASAQGELFCESGMLAICALAGVSNAMFLVAWLMAIQKNAMVSVDVSLTLGSLIPSVLCAVLFAEALSISKMFGFLLILLATFVMAGYSKQTNAGGAFGFVLLFFAALGDGMSGFAQQLYKQYYTEVGSQIHGVYYPKEIYHFYTYVFAALCLLVVLVAYRLMQGKKTGERVTVRKMFAVTPSVMVYIVVMAICMFAANYFQTVAANDYGVPSQMLYPIFKGGCLITVNLTAMIFFGEKITWRSIFGSLLALAGIISMSIL